MWCRHPHPTRRNADSLSHAARSFEEGEPGREHSPLPPGHTSFKQGPNKRGQSPLPVIPKVRGGEGDRRRRGGLMENRRMRMQGRWTGFGAMLLLVVANGCAMQPHRTQSSLTGPRLVVSMTVQGSPLTGIGINPVYYYFFVINYAVNLPNQQPWERRRRQALWRFLCRMVARPALSPARTAAPLDTPITWNSITRLHRAAASGCSISFIQILITCRKSRQPSTASRRSMRSSTERRCSLRSI